jgi:histone H3/H4
MRLQDLNLPKSIVQRLAKGVLPPNTQIQKDALLAMSKSATVFVNYITST